METDLTKVIFDKARDQYAVVVSKEEIIAAIKARLHQDFTDRFPEGQVPIRYARSLERSHIPYVIGEKGPWHYDVLPESVVRLWSLSKKELEEAYQKEKLNCILLEEAYQKEKKREEIEKSYKLKDSKLLEDKIKNSNSVAQ